MICLFYVVFPIFIYFYTIEGYLMRTKYKIHLSCAKKSFLEYNFGKLVLQKQIKLNKTS
jgi:hypothetical protein